MADFVPIVQTSRCEVRMQQGTNLQENTYWYRWASSIPPSASQLLQLATEVAAGIGAATRAMMHSSVVMREVYCRNMHTEEAEQGTFVFPGGTQGQRVGNAVASNEASGIVRRTGFTGRSNHGRVSMSGFAEGDVDGNSLSSQLMGLLTNLAVEMLVDLVAQSFIAALGSKTNSNSKPILSTVVLDSNVDSQKTRLNAHGT